LAGTLRSQLVTHIRLLFPQSHALLPMEASESIRGQGPGDGLEQPTLWRRSRKGYAVGASAAASSAAAEATGSTGRSSVTNNKANAKGTVCA